MPTSAVKRSLKALRDIDTSRASRSVVQSVPTSPWSSASARPICGSLRPASQPERVASSVSA
jgi:hypothetical protein